jgi:amino acid transporter
MRSKDGNLARAIGLWGLAASIVNITIGGGIFRLPASPDVSGRLGAAAPLAYLVCAVVMGLIVLCIAQAGSRIALTGGPYAYVEATFGSYAGFVVGVLLWVVFCTAMPAVAGLLADSAAHFIPAFGTPVGRAGFLAVVFALIAAINVVGVRQGTRLNAVMAVAKLAPLVLLLVAGVFVVHGANLRWTNGVPAVSDLSRASVFMIFAFAGVESALVPSGEVRDPARTVPRAVFLAMGMVTLLYIGLHLVAQGMLGPALVGDPTPLASTATKIFGPAGGAALSIGFVISAFGYLSGMALSAPRTLFAFARDGYLPRQLAAVHPKYQTPWIAIIVQTAIAWLLAVTSGFEALVIIANVSVAIIYLGCAAAAFKLRRAPTSADGFTVPGGGVVPVVAALAVLFLLSSVTRAEWAILAELVFAATVVYIITLKSRAALV